MRSKKVYIALLVLILLGLGAFGVWTQQRSHDTEPIVTTDVIKNVSRGRVAEGDNSASGTALATNTELEFESEEIATNNPTTTAAVLRWDQSGGEEGAHVEFRTYDGNEWSPWIESDSSDGKDGTPANKSAIIISKDIKKVQYKFHLEAVNGSSPTIELADAVVETIDTSRGPSFEDKTPLWKRLLSGLKLENSAQARFGQPTPQIYSRSDWGSPEPNSSPNWEPEYRPLTRAIVHHTATTASADSAAAVRAIWQYHTQSNGWGDIGYNYLVDQSGRIYQGRYYDQAYADANNVDVVAGHAYGNNYGTTGIAMLGDFTNTNPSGASINSVARVAAFKLGAYNLNPADGSNLIGHRDVVATACPGARLYPQLGTIRSVANSLFPEYQVRPYSWQYVTQYAYTDDTKTTAVNLQTATRGQRVYMGVRAKNVGTEPWYNSGDTPVRIGTSRPTSRNSSGCDNTWISCARPASMIEEEVPVGEIGTFEFWYNVPEVGIDTNEYFNLLAENVMWMNDPGLYFRVVAPTATYSWQLVSQYAYTDDTKTTGFNLANLTAGQRAYIGFTARNTGNTTWTNTGNFPVRVGTSDPTGRSSSFCDPSWLNCTRPANLLQSSVAPGETGNFEFWYKAPGDLGEYRERFNLVAENYRWMNDPGMNFYARVANPALNSPDTDRLIINQTLGPNQSISSKDGRFRLIMQGDGNLVLYSPNRYLWATNTNGRSATRFVMQSDGNLVLYTSSNAPVWNSNTAGRGQSYLVLQNDGNLVLYNAYGQPLWNTGTHGRL